MNLLSLSSAMLATAFLIGGVYCLTRNRKSELNIFSFFVLISLGWWSFGNAFFFSAATEEAAWKWHHLASLGWTGFVVETSYYFIVLTGIRDRMKKLWIQLSYCLLPAVLIIYNFFGKTSSLAVELTRSRVGHQWAYVNSPDNVWLWIYLAYVVLYFGLGFILLLQWASRVKHKLKRKMAIGFVVLDGFTILLGAVTDVIFPLSSQLIPSVANLCTAIFGVGYFFIIIRYDLFNIRHVVEESDVIEHSMEALMVTDEDGEILDVNSACSRLFDLDKGELMGRKVSSLFDEKAYCSLINTRLKDEDCVNGVELPIVTGDGERKQLMISGSVIRDRLQEYMGTVLSIRDITQLNRLKEQYKVQSEEYEILAFMDTLTGLPNRRRTFEFLNKCVKQYEEMGMDFFVLYMDMDHFKSVNDRYGHNIGDRFLKLVSDRLKGCMREETKFLGRLSGDEFLMVGFDDKKSRDIPHLIISIREAFREEFVFNDIRIKSGVSVGYARYSEFENIDDMIHCADESMYRMKQGKDNGYL